MDAVIRPRERDRYYGKTRRTNEKRKYKWDSNNRKLYTVLGTQNGYPEG